MTIEGTAGKGGSAAGFGPDDASLVTEPLLKDGNPLSTIVNPAAAAVTTPRRDAVADVLEQHAADAATGSRDFGRGYMHAVRLCREMDLEGKVRHHERQLCATELLILAERNDDSYLGGQLILAAVAISRREVA